MKVVPIVLVRIYIRLDNNNARNLCKNASRGHLPRHACEQPHTYLPLSRGWHGQGVRPARTAASAVRNFFWRIVDLQSALQIAKKRETEATRWEETTLARCV